MIGMFQGRFHGVEIWSNREVTKMEGTIISFGEFDIDLTLVDGNKSYDFRTPTLGLVHVDCTGKYDAEKRAFEVHNGKNHIVIGKISR